MKKHLLSFLLIGAIATAKAQSTTIAISQVYGGGGASTGSPAYTNDYVELHNLTAADIVIAGYSLQYASATGNFSTGSTLYVFGAGVTIPAYGYLTVKTGAAGTAGATFTADITTSNLNMAAGGGKVALVNSGTALGCGATATPCTLPNANIIDLVAYGTSNNAEGGASVNNGAAMNSTQGGVRVSFGCTDTDNNNADFTVATTATGLTPRTAASGTTVNCSTLPVNITSFSGRKKENAVELSWSVVNEQNINAYSVERSSNGSNSWAMIGTVLSTNANGAKTYTFVDMQPLKGTALYRLKQLEANGSHKYSAIVPVSFDPAINSFTLSPNPAKGSTFIRSLSTIAERVQVRVMDASGRTVLQQAGLISMNSPFRIDLTALNEGQYFVETTTGASTQTQKVLVSK